MTPHLNQARSSQTWYKWALLGAIVLATGAMSLTAPLPELRSWFVLAAFVAGAAVVLLWRNAECSTREVLVTALLLRLLVFWLPPCLSDDVYRYVWDGNAQARELNPYLHLPAELEGNGLGDPALFAELNSQTYYSVYPPVSQGIFLVGAYLGDGWYETYFVIKGILALLEFGAVLLLSRLASPGALLLYALSPLVVIESAGQAHTEGAAVFFLVLALWLARRNRAGLSASAFALAGWVKLYPFVLLPYLWRRFGVRAVWPVLLVSLVVVAPYWHPSVLGNVSQSLDLYVRYFEFNAGPYYFLKEVYRSLSGEDVSKTLGPLLRAAFLLLLPCLYLLDFRQRLSLGKVMLLTVGAYLCLATTVHPWYLLPVLALAAAADRPAWHWQWLAVCSLGTYLLYTGGPYWLFVILGWSGFAVLGLFARREMILEWIQLRRARRKTELLLGTTGNQPLAWVLDLGAAEGYVGWEIRKATGAEVMLADVVDMNRTDLPLVLYDGAKLPFPDDSFDLVVLSYVLHHCTAPEQVLRESLRVGRRVFILESLNTSPIQLRALTLADKAANRWRSGGRMNAQEEHLAFRSDAEWIGLFEQLGARVVIHRTLGRFFHPQGLYLLQAGAAINNRQSAR